MTVHKTTGAFRLSSAAAIAVETVKFTESATRTLYRVRYAWRKVPQIPDADIIDEAAALASMPVIRARPSSI
jgi:hypothetical protein